MTKPKIKYKKIKVYVPAYFPSIGLLAKESGLKADRIRSFLHQMFMARLKQLSNRKLRNTTMYKNGWVTIHSNILEKAVTYEYKRFIDFLEKRGSIELRRDSITGRVKYTPNEESIQYRIPGKYLYKDGSVRHFRREEIGDHCTLKGLYKLSISQAKNHISIEKMTPTHLALNKMMKSVRFDLKSAEEYLQKILRGEIVVRETNSGQRNYSDMLLQMTVFNNRERNINTIDAFGERYHTIFTSLWKELRQFIRFDGIQEPLVSLDLANSQPYFSSIAINSNLIETVVPEFKPCIPLLQSLEQSADFKKYAELCASGKLYEHLMAIRNVDRSTAKEDIFYTIYGGNRMPPKKNRDGSMNKDYLMKDSFRKEFPSVHKVFFAIKAMNEKQLPFITNVFVDSDGKFEGKKSLHKNLSCLMQRLESRIILQRIAGKLIENGITLFITVHDSFILQESSAETAKEIIIREFKNLGVTPPTIKQEKL